MIIKSPRSVKTIGELSAELVDRFSENVSERLETEGFNKKEVLRFRLSVENAMCVWLEKLGEGHKCELFIRKHFGKISIELSCEGDKCDPRENCPEEFGSLSDFSLLQTLGFSMGYTYENGINRISVLPNNSAIMHLIPVAMSFVFGLILAFAVIKLFPDKSSIISEQIVSPIFTALMNLLKSIAGPLIFLAVLSGIYGIGDVETLGNIGKKLFGRFVLMTFVALIVSLVLLLFIVPVQSGEYEGGKGALSSLITMVLQFIPTDIVSPFLDGNMLQIIFIAVACGVGMLILGKSVSALNNIISQIYAVVQLLMETIGKLIPVYVFISIFDFVLSGTASNMGNVFYPVLVIIGTLVIIVLNYAVHIKYRYKLNIRTLLGKMLPTFLIAFSTASSAAAFSVNVDTCEEGFGISQKITRFGIPLGQVAYMPFAAVEYLSLSMILASNYNVSITPMWIVTALFVSGILAIATPPIPGGSMSIFTILFLQLGIPSSVLAIAISVDVLVDYLVTAGDIACLQEELIVSAGSTGYLDRDILLKK